MTERSLHVLFVIPSLDRGGSERQMINLASSMNRLGHQATIGTLIRSGTMAEAARLAGVEVIDLSGGSGRLIRGLLGLVRHVRRTRPAVIHPYLPRDNALATIMKPLLRRSHLVWGVRASDMDLSKYRRSTRLLWPLVVRASRHADLCIANSHDGAEYHISEGYPRDRMSVVPNGIDTVVFRPDRAAGLAFRRQYGIDPLVPVVGLIGRFDPMKGHDRFADIFRRVLDDVPDCRALVVGAHSESQARTLLSTFDNLGIVDRLTLVDEVAHPANTFNACSVIALPSYSEGFPNVLAEALACGVPTVAFDVGDARQISGSLCPVVEQNDMEAFSSALVDCLRNPPEADLLARHIEQTYSLETLAQATAQLLQDLVDDQGR
jgi:glycosyltransferase involved in cell wall biosynthesis